MQRGRQERTWFDQPKTLAGGATPKFETVIEQPTAKSIPCSVTKSYPYPLLPRDCHMSKPCPLSHIEQRRTDLTGLDSKFKILLVLTVVYSFCFFFN